jgi:adenine phosphoribosyltransferase
MDLKNYINTIHDYPSKGIIFRDINALVKNPKAFIFSIEKLTEIAKKFKINAVAAVDARGFLFGAPVALKLKKKLILVRKSNKLPGSVYKVTYKTEYSTGLFEIQKNSINKNDRILLIDDLLATGGSLAAISKLIDQTSGTLVAAAFVIDINLSESKQIKNKLPIYSLVNY